MAAVQVPRTLPASGPKSPEEIAAELRWQREQAVKKAWRRFTATAGKRARRKLRKLPPTGVYRNEPTPPI